MNKKEFYILVMNDGEKSAITVSGEIIVIHNKQLGIHRAEHTGGKARKWDYVLTDIDSGLRIRNFARKNEAVAYVNGQDIELIFLKMQGSKWYKESKELLKSLKEKANND